MHLLAVVASILTLSLALWVVLSAVQSHAEAILAALAGQSLRSQAVEGDAAAGGTVMAFPKPRPVVTRAPRGLMPAPLPLAA